MKICENKTSLTSIITTDESLRAATILQKYLEKITMCKFAIYNANSFTESTCDSNILSQASEINKVIFNLSDKFRENGFSYFIESKNIHFLAKNE